MYNPITPHPGKTVPALRTVVFQAMYWRLFFLLSGSLVVNFVAHADPLADFGSTQKILGGQVQPNQQQPAVARNARGDFILVWQGGPKIPDHSAIFARRYTPDLTPEGKGFRVSPDHAIAYWPKVAMASTGAFIITWTAPYHGHDAVFARQYQADGKPVGDAFPVAHHADRDLGLSDVGMDDDGNFTLAWIAIGDQDVPDTQVYIRRYLANGKPANMPARKSEDASLTGRPAIAMQAGGRFVMAWIASDDGQGAVFVQRFATDGQPLGKPIRVDTHRGGKRAHPVVAMNANGDFVVAWLERFVEGQPSFMVHARHFTADGSAGPDLQLSASREEKRESPTVALDVAGAFTVAWNELSDDGWNIVAYHFEADGLPGVNGGIQLNDDTEHVPGAPALLSLGKGRLLATWDESHWLGGEKTIARIQGRIFETSPAPKKLVKGFGTHLPEGFTRWQLLDDLAANVDPARLTLAGVKPWPGKPGQFVAALCLLQPAEQKYPVSRPYCGDGLMPGSDVLIRLGVYRRDASGKPVLVARTPHAVQTPTNWRYSKLAAPQPLDENDDGLLPARWDRFDLANYRLGDNDLAFGVRASWWEGYSGGGKNFGALYLFRINGDKLDVILAEPMTARLDLAGDWREDGSREHHVTEHHNVLWMLPRTTHGFHDIHIQQAHGDWHHIFHWSEDRQRYIGAH